MPKGSSFPIHAQCRATLCYNIKIYLIFFIISHHSHGNCTLRSKPSSCVCFSILLASSSFGDLKWSFLHFPREMTNTAGCGSSTIWSMTPSAPGVIQIRFWSLSIRLCHCGPAVPLSGESLSGLVSQWTLEAFLHLPGMQLLQLALFKKNNNKIKNSAHNLISGNCCTVCP